jgi:phosphoglycolate phosphatase-like HAD superfamily hydrolase
MRLVIFDIDGTLTQTMKADEECFVRSLAEVCGFRDVDTDGSRYKHATDSGVFREIHEARTGRSPSPMEISRVRQHFVEMLAGVSSDAPFAAVEGAPLLLSRLADSAEHRVALATGAWRDSARLKMASAGMCFDDHPAASADDAHDRESIMKISLQRAVERHETSFVSTIYVGDEVWDARACRALGIPFIGIGSGGRAVRLASEGAIRVFGDYSDTDLFLESLDEIAKAV